jgi:hypothetical protein
MLLPTKPLPSSASGPVSSLSCKQRCRRNVLRAVELLDADGRVAVAVQEGVGDVARAVNRHDLIVNVDVADLVNRMTSQRHDHVQEFVRLACRFQKGDRAALAHLAVDELMRCGRLTGVDQDALRSRASRNAAWR